MKHSIPHSLSHALARKATQTALDTYRQRFTEYQPSGEWVTPDRAQVRFVVMGKTLAGVVDVLPDRIDLELDVPLLFRPFRSAAMQVIEDEIRTWIERAKRGELGA